jgi:PTH1 family peptidyl-tRNA hydrolase
MLLIIGLGNPGSEHAHQRHNIGWMALDRIHQRNRFSPWKARFQGISSDGQLGGTKCLLLKPTTYYNESGRAAAEAMRFHKLTPSDVVVFHDELALEPSKIRMKSGGGSAGNNGIKSLEAHLGADFRRVRIGIGHPGHRDMVHGYVLHNVPKADLVWLDPALDALADHAALLADGRDDLYMNKVTLAIRAAGASYDQED